MSKLSQEKLKWFYETQQYLKENLDLDTTKPEDIGRLRIAYFYNVREEGIYRFEEKVLSGAELTGDENISFQYAFVKRDLNSKEYDKTFDDSTVDALLQSQKCFNVIKKEDGTYEMETALEDDQLEQIYECAKDGRFFANEIGKSFGLEDTKSRLITVSKDGGALPLDLPYTNLKQLTKAQQVDFAMAHTEYLKKQAGNVEATRDASLEIGGYNKAAGNPDFYIKRANDISEMGITLIAQDEEFCDRKYMSYVCDTIASGTDKENILTKDEFVVFTHSLKELIDNPIMAYDPDARLGLDRLFYYDEKDVQLKRVSDIIDENLPKEAQDKQLAKLLVKLKNENNLYVYQEVSVENERINTLKRVDMSGNNYYSPKFASPLMARPTAPGFFKTLLHKLSKKMFKKDFERYEMAKAKAEFLGFKAEQHPNTSEFARAEQEEKKEEVRKTYTKEQAYERVAKTILNELKSLKFEYVMKFDGITPKDLLKESKFMSFVQSPDMEETVNLSMQGYKISDCGVKFAAFLEKSANERNQVANQGANVPVQEDANKQANEPVNEGEVKEEIKLEEPGL